MKKISSYILRKKGKRGKYPKIHIIYNNIFN